MGIRYAFLKGTGQISSLGALSVATALCVRARCHHISGSHMFPEEGEQAPPRVPEAWVLVSEVALGF